MKPTLALIALLPVIAYSQGISTGSSYLRFPLTARSASLGETLVAEPRSIGSAGINPANLFRTTGGEILLTHTSWGQDVQTEYFSAGYAMSFGTVGVSLLSSSIPNIEIRDNPGQALGTFSARSAYLQASYATSIDSTVRIGVSGKFLYDKLYVEESSGYAFDVGILYESPIPGLLAGLSASNVGNMGQFVNQRSDLPVQVRMGIAYRFAVEQFDVLVASQFTREGQQLNNSAHLGLELNYRQMLALRIGYQTGYEARSLSAGFGLQYEWIKIDYAYIPFLYDLGNAHLFTLGFDI